ncbi:MAG: PAS domain-containing protein, partial [Elusimicrobia bacterium]|nr:PAS domain-containing protein [Elusimicrobiota bacterium]
MKPAAAKNTDTQQLLKTLRAANRLIEAASRGELSNRMPLEAQGKPLRGEMLRTARAVNSLLERLRAGDEETRKDGHSDLYNIIKNNDDGILVVDSGGVVRFANPAAAALLRRNAQALVGRPFPYSAQAGKLTEVEIPHAGGEPGVAELRATAILWEGQKAVLATLRDNTERKRSEEKLRQSEVQFRLIAENVADLIALVDLDGRRLYSSPSYRI